MPKIKTKYITLEGTTALNSKDLAEKIERAVRSHI